MSLSSVALPSAGVVIIARFLGPVKGSGVLVLVDDRGKGGKLTGAPDVVASRWCQWRVVGPGPGLGVRWFCNIRCKSMMHDRVYLHNTYSVNMNCHELTTNVAGCAY